MDKEHLKEIVKAWVIIDNEINALQLHLNTIKKEKKEKTALLMEIMKNNEVFCFDTKEFQIKYISKNSKKPISKNTILNLLGNYFDGDVTKAQEINNYIFDNRENKITECIVKKTTSINDLLTIED
jgi:hypothetical protein